MSESGMPNRGIFVRNMISGYVRHADLSSTKDLVRYRDAVQITWIR